MKFLQKDRTRKKRNKTQIPKTGLFSYTSYLQQRKKVPYDLSYNSFMQYCFKAKHYPGKALNNILMLIEHRLDVALYRIRFCRTIFEARQFINHNKVFINGNPNNLPSYHLKPGDIIQVKPGHNISSPDFSIIKKKSKVRVSTSRIIRKSHLQRSRFKRIRPSWLFRPLHFEVNFKIATAIFLYPPQQLFFSKHLNFDLIRRSFRKTL